MRSPWLIPLLCVACATTSNGKAGNSAASGGGDDEVSIERETTVIRDGRPVPKPTEAEKADFNRIWELYRKNDRRWPVERDRFKARSDAAGYLLAWHLLRHYMRVNAARERAGDQLEGVMLEIIAVGAPCAPYLANMMVLDQIEVGGQMFRTDDLTRRDCQRMLGGMGSQATPELLRVLKRKDLGVKGRRLAALALGETRDPRAYVPLVKLLINDPSWQVRADAAEALGKLGDRRALKPLADAAERDPDPAVVKRATKARRRLLVGGQ